MTQEERLLYLIKYLVDEQPELRNMQIPDTIPAQKRLLRSLMNIRLPYDISSEFLEIQDAYLTEELNKKGIVSIKDMTPIKKDMYLWKGDITRLEVDAIVNAANDQMLGCFIPCHGCIDNAIHSAAGIQLRLACNDLMQALGKREETGNAQITEAYNLPSRYVIHTVGPIIMKELSKHDCDLLRSCYLSCLQLADAKQLNSIAFCCISTGEFHFPNEKAAEIAIAAVEGYKEDTRSEIEVIFNVFKEEDERIYQRLLR